MSNLLEVKNLDVKFDTDEGRITAVENISFTLQQGKVLGIVGESGSGKSVTAKSIMQLNPGIIFYNNTFLDTIVLGRATCRHLEPWKKRGWEENYKR